jgi:hypothetical protein
MFRSCEYDQRAQLHDALLQRHLPEQRQRHGLGLKRGFEELVVVVCMRAIT